MNANELRIGNLVFMSREKEPKYKGYHGRVFNFDLIDYIEHLHPIPLAEDWLLKFGFYETTKEHYVSGLYTLNKPDGFYINKETMCYCDIDYEGTTNDRIKIQYVHQLQNLYFALTGEELTEGGDK
jgi:hypothetical protein